MATHRVCFVCGQGGARSFCSGCKSVRYCSKYCQTEHWRMGHRAECKELAALAEDLAALGSAGAANLVATTVARVEAFVENHPTGSCAAMRGPIWRHWASCTGAIIASDADDRTKFSLCLELCAAMKQTRPGLMKICSDTSLSKLRAEMRRILAQHPAVTPEECAWLRQQTIDLGFVIMVLTEESDGAWEDDEWLAFRAQHLASAPPGVRLLPWEAGTKIEWTPDTETWHPAVVVDRWYLQDLESQKILMANLPLSQVRLRT